MIDHKEVRIGNTLKSSDSIKLINVFHIDEDDDRGRINYIGANNYEPVELTPYILEAAGFTNGIKTIETSFLETEFYVDLMDGDAGFNKHGLWFPCKHLHQLQNLYWCLCGDELQIDITKLNKEK